MFASLKQNSIHPSPKLDQGSLDKEQLQHIMEHSEDLIMVDDGGRDGNSPKIIYASKVWYKFGYKSDPVGHYIHEFVSPETMNTCLALKNQQIADSPKNEWTSYTFTGKMNGINVETILSKMGDRVLSISRNIEDRIKCHEAEKKLAIETTARLKDAEANKFTRHEVKNGLLSIISQLDSIKKMHEIAVKDGTSSSIEHQKDIDFRMTEIITDADRTLQTVLAEAMAKDVVNNEYIPQIEKCDLSHFIHSLRQYNSKWYIFPSVLPLIKCDEQLLFYIVRNAISNASKYGKKWGEINTKLTIAGRKLSIVVENEPGDDHHKLVMLQDPNVVFNKGIRLHKFNPEPQSRNVSSGDGAWIMQTCAKLLGGQCKIEFIPAKTVLTFECEIELYVQDQDLKNFEFPTNTIVYVVDDSRIQRRMLGRQVTNMGINESNCIVLGKDREEIRALEQTLHTYISSNKNHYHVILCDENLDYRDEHGNLGHIQGSDVCFSTTHNLTLQDCKIVTFIRSANDSRSDQVLYLTKADGFITKQAHTTDELIRKIATAWIKKFGIPDKCCRNTTENTNVKDILIIFLQDVDDFIYQPIVKDQWETFWSGLHNLKGSLQILQHICSNESLIGQIENLRDNSFNDEFDVQWRCLCDDLEIYKVRCQEVLGQIEHQEQQEQKYNA